MPLLTGIFLGLLVLIAFCYSLQIILITAGWFATRKYPGAHGKRGLKMSVIVPARNEETHIIGCLESLFLQDYNKDLYEVIVVDDFSTDATAMLVNEFHRTHPSFHVRLLSTENQAVKYNAKKAAIQLAIENSSADIIVTTDADCTAGPVWLSTLAGYFEDYNPKMISGPVRMEGKGFFQACQSLEFLSYIVTGAAAARLNLPSLANGANLAYTRNLFLQAGGYAGDKYASGDDVSLLLRAKKISGTGSIHFIMDINALITTKPVKTLKEFFNQRIRWASKAKGYRDVPLIFISLSVFLFNLLILIGFWVSIFQMQLLVYVAGLFLLKCVTEFPVMAGICSFTRQHKLLWYFLPVGIFNLFYISITGISSLIFTPRWKGRKL